MGVLVDDTKRDVFADRFRRGGGRHVDSDALALPHLVVRHKPRPARDAHQAGLDQRLQTRARQSLAAGLDRVGEKPVETLANLLWRNEKFARANYSRASGRGTLPVCNIDKLIVIKQASHIMHIPGWKMAALPA